MILEVKDMDYAYRGRGTKQVLHHVSAQFEKGKFYAITGASGAGKTTFLSLLAGLDTPTGEPSYTTEKISKHRGWTTTGGIMYRSCSRTIT